MSLLRAARRWRARRAREEANDALRLTLDGAALTRPRLLGMSRAGRLSWRAHLDGRPVKIYECHSAEQAEFLEAVATRPELGPDFPAPVARRGALLIVEWVAGQPISRRDLERDPRLLARLAQMQARLHAVASQELPEPSFSYPEWLTRRWRRRQGVLPFQEALDRLLEILEGAAPDLEPRISHPDVSGANLVVEAPGAAPRLVDNELLSAGPWYPVDLLATHHSFGAGSRQGLARAYLEAYAEAGGRTAALAEHGRYFEALWRLARIGSLLQDGAFGHAAAEARSCLEGAAAAHPLVVLARRMSGAA